MENCQLRTKGLIFVIIGSTLWGVSGVVAQYLFENKGFTPEWLVMVRLLGAGLSLVLYACIKGDKNIYNIWKTKSNIIKIVLFSVFGMVGVQYPYFVGITYGNAATATILQYLAPVIITLYVAFKFRKVPNLKEIIAISLAMIGAFFIITKGNIRSISISKLALFWGIISAFAAAFYTLYPKKLITKWGSTTVAGWAMVVGGVVFTLLLRPWHFSGQWSLISIVAVIFVIFFGTLIPFHFYLESLKYIKPTEASVLGSFEPLSAALLSVLCLNVPLGMAQWLGTLCIIGTVVILSKA